MKIFLIILTIAVFTGCSTPNKGMEVLPASEEIFPEGNLLFSLDKTA
jgi:uncharacterized lipoprotein YajG